MTRQYAKVKVSIWGDDDFSELSESAQALYLKLLSHPTLNLCGVADWRPKRLAALTKGQTAETVRTAARELSEGLYIVTDDESEEVLIRSFLRNDETVKNPKVAVAVAREYSAVTSRKLRGVIAYEMQRLAGEHPDWSGLDLVHDILDREGIDARSLIDARCDDEKPTDDTQPNTLYIGAKPKENTQPDNQSDYQSEGSSKTDPYPLTLNPQPTTPTPNPSKPDDGEDENSQFSKFLSAYPKHGNTGETRRQWRELVRQGLATPGQLIAAATAYATAMKAEGKQIRWIPLPANWLANRVWLDYQTKPEAERLEEGWISTHLMERLPPGADGWQARRMLVGLVKQGAAKQDAADQVLASPPMSVERVSA